MVKRYAMTTEASLMKKRPKDHVRPRRNSRAKAPRTQDLKDGNKKKDSNNTDKSSVRSFYQKRMNQPDGQKTHCHPNSIHSNNPRYNRTTTASSAGTV